MKKHYVIINPHAGHGKAQKAIPVIKDFYAGRKIPAEFLISEYPGNTIELVRQITEENPIVISVGGDGTLNECINGLNLALNPVLGLISIGTGNDFVKNIAHTTDITENLINIAEHAESDLILSDISKAIFRTAKGEKERLFINTIGVGFDAQVAHLMEKSRILNGIPAYLINVLKALLSYKYIDAKISSSGKVLSDYSKRFLICIGNGISSGGGFYLTPRAEINDGFLDLTDIENVPKLRVLRKLPKALTNELETVNEASMYKDKMFEIELKEPSLIHIDGEFEPEPVSYIRTEIHDKQIRIIKL